LLVHRPVSIDIGDASRVNTELEGDGVEAFGVLGSSLPVSGLDGDYIDPILNRESGLCILTIAAGVELPELAIPGEVREQARLPIFVPILSNRVVGGVVIEDELFGGFYLLVLVALCGLCTGRIGGSGTGRACGGCRAG